MFHEKSASQASLGILQQVRASHLNFVAQETPFTIFLTIRKSFNKNFLNMNQEPSLVPSENLSALPGELQTLKSLNQALHAKVYYLENDKASLLKNYEDEVLTSESLKCNLDAKEEAIDNLLTKLENLESSNENLKNEKEQIKKKHEKSCTEIKTLKVSEEELMKKHEDLSVALKTSKKESKDKIKDLDKLCANLEGKIQDLNHFKVTKLDEEKELKVKQKKAEKKLKLLVEREAKIRLKEEKIKREALTLDDNRNESIETKHESKPTVPIENMFEALNDIQPSDSIYNEVTNSSDALCQEQCSQLAALQAAIIRTEKSLNSALSSNSSPSAKSLNEPWKCNLCEITIPMGFTFEKMLHKNKHENENKN
jgi:myosin heavy subunit